MKSILITIVFIATVSIHVGATAAGPIPIEDATGKSRIVGINY